MADDNKAVGPLAAAKLIALIKAETAKKYDKTGGKIDGSAEITGNVHAGGAVQSDLLLSAPSVAVRNDAVGASVHINCSGDNAAGISSLGSDGKSHYSRFAVGMPTGDNDAATKAYVDGRTHDYYDVTVVSAADAAQTIDGGIISVRGSADKTVAEISAAYAAGDIVRCIYNGNIMQLVRAADESYSFAGTGANYGVARDGNITVTIMSTTSSGDVTLITSAAGELPIPDSDASQNGCALVVRDGQWMYSEDKLIPATPTSNGLMSAADKVKLDGVEDGATKTIVDDAMSDTSTNPVQNKAVKAALDSKLSTQGGEILGHLSVGLTVSAEGPVSTGRTSTDTGIHFEKAGSDVGRISHGSDPMTGVSPIARLKVASPTEDDDAATKAYVDGRAVRYDAAQTLTDAQKAQARENVDAASAFAPILTSPVMIRKERATDSTGVYLSTIGIGEKRAEIRLEDVNENAPVAIANLRTPTGAGTDNYAATKGYVDSKVASGGGGVTVDTAMSDTSTNPVQNKTIKQYVDDHAVSLPLTLTYANGQATGAAYTDIRKAIERGRQIKLSVANTPDIIASNTRNETNKSVLKFIHTDVGGDTVNITQYTVTAQASGLTVHVKSHEIA